jgi:hypothetical protein
LPFFLVFSKIPREFLPGLSSISFLSLHQFKEYVRAFGANAELIDSHDLPRHRREQVIRTAPPTGRGCRLAGATPRTQAFAPHRAVCGCRSIRHWPRRDMKETATVKIFLAEGDPASVRIAEISNWTGRLWRDLDPGWN